MKTVCIHSCGGPNVLVCEDAPHPHPDDAEARVHADTTLSQELSERGHPGGKIARRTV
jgi:hypothetical protein